MASRQEVTAALEASSNSINGKISQLQEIENRFDDLANYIQEIAAESAVGIAEGVQEGIEAGKQCCTNASELLLQTCDGIQTYMDEVL